MKKISVVIPVYNVENYLSECLDSIISQTYKNLQIILVDDGSTDNSGNICDDYAKKDNRITVIHQANQGAGAAKNAGLDLVKGEYFSIIDSDDYVEHNYYETMISAMEKYNADVVQCLFRNVFKNININRNYNFPSKNGRLVSSNQFLFELLYDWKYAIFANKLFKTKLLQDIRFPVGRKIDDEFFTYKLICSAKKIVNINNVLYNYRMRQSSVMNDNNNIVLLKDRADCYIERMDYINSCCKSLSKVYYNNFADFIRSCLNTVSNDEDRIYFNNLKSNYPINEDSLVSKIKMKHKMKKFLYDKEVSKDYGKAFI